MVDPLVGADIKVAWLEVQLIDTHMATVTGRIVTTTSLLYDNCFRVRRVPSRRLLGSGIHTRVFSALDCDICLVIHGQGQLKMTTFMNDRGCADIFIIHNRDAQLVFLMLKFMMKYVQLSLRSAIVKVLGRQEEESEGRA